MTMASNACNKRHRQRCQKANKRFHSKHPEYKQNYNRTYRWKRLQINLTPEQYDTLFRQQNGVCAICGKADLLRSLAVDHDHQTGQIRGLLCTVCNRWIVSVVEKYPHLVTKASLYLEGYKNAPAYLVSKT